ncbi:MAG: hypothetical protein IKW21_01330 [Lachnospiraceae bacterium]|nr:hypothetical protein [Lachnospiraceae bacterium]
MGLFKKNTYEIVEAEPKNEIATIEVRDIKQYLADEYERSRNLNAENERLRDQIRRSEEIKLKYDASLITLEEYKVRIDELERQLKKERENTEYEKERFKAAVEETNTYKIIMNRTAMEKNKIRAEVIAEIKGEIVERIKDFKGNLSKAKAIELVEMEGGNDE